MYIVFEIHNQDSIYVVRHLYSEPRALPAHGTSSYDKFP